MIVKRRERYESLMKGCTTSKASDTHRLPSYEQFKPVPNSWLKKNGTGPAFIQQLTRRDAKKVSGNGGFAVMHEAGVPFEPPRCMDSFKSKQ